MLTILLSLTFSLFGALYPVFFWTVSVKGIEIRIHRFTLALSSLAGGIGIIFLWLLEVNKYIRISAVVWLITLLAVTWFFWNRSRVLPWVASIPSFFGVIVYSQVIGDLIGRDLILLLISILGGLILTATVFSMVLGHRYLNVIDLPISLLRRIVRLLIVLLILRALWDGFAFLDFRVDVNGYAVSLFQFIQSFDGFFLFVALIFGTFLPLLFSILTLRMIAIHSTQSATGLLYVMVISVIMGDLFYKYYLLQFGLFL